MEAPLCKTCKSRHWGTCYTRPERSPAAIRQQIKPKLDAAISKLAPAAVFDEAPSITPEKAAVALEFAKRRGRPATGFDKKAYDREKAKARRAAKKETPK